MSHTHNTLLIRNVRPYGEGDGVDVTIRDGIITRIGPTGDTASADRVLDGNGGVLLPGLVDMHVHLREPGDEFAETIESGSRAAAHGGFTAVFAMPNTDPVTDNAAVAESVWRKGQDIGLCDVQPVGSITKGREGAILSEFGLMRDSAAQVRMFSDDGCSVGNSQVMRRAAEYARGVDVLLAEHAEDPDLAANAQAHEGPVAAELGLTGWPRSAEESIVARDILFARDYGARIHFCHLSSAGSIELVRWAKEHSIPVTAEVTPHHLLLTDESLRGYDALFKVNPPLREMTDVEALRQALVDGVIDVVASDHAPHTRERKMCEFEAASPGIAGLETSLTIIAELFVTSGKADWRFVAKVMSERPAEITRLSGHGRPIAEKEPANLTVVDDNATWTAHAAEMETLSQQSPFEGYVFHNRVAATILNGEVTYSGA